ncbi:MAG: hypothetical protein ABUS57_00085 [Pseudomonadota bacterium]
MRSVALAGVVALSFCFAPAAFADAAHSRSQAIQACRAEVAQRAGVAADAVRLDNVRDHGRQIRVDLKFWKAGGLTNVQCEVAVSGDSVQIASIDPPLAAQSATAQ